MPLKVRIGAFAQSALAYVITPLIEIFVGDCFEGPCGTRPSFCLVTSRIFAKLDAGVKLFGYFTDFDNAKGRSGTKCHAALFCAELVLENKCPRSLLAQSEPKAGHVIVKKDRFGFPGRQAGRAYGLR